MARKTGSRRPERPGRIIQYTNLRLPPGQAIEALAPASASAGFVFSPVKDIVAFDLFPLAVLLCLTGVDSQTPLVIRLLILVFTEFFMAVCPVTVVDQYPDLFSGHISQPNAPGSQAPGP